jgi:hypothetical protein
LNSYFFMHEKLKTFLFKWTLFIFKICVTSYFSVNSFLWDPLPSWEKTYICSLYIKYKVCCHLNLPWFPLSPFANRAPPLQAFSICFVFSCNVIESGIWDYTVHSLFHVHIFYTHLQLPYINKAENILFPVTTFIGKSYPPL